MNRDIVLNFRVTEKERQIIEDIHGADREGDCYRAERSALLFQGWTAGTAAL